MFNFRVAAGPMSKEIVEAVFQYSDETGSPVALIASKNQIDYDSGYVEGWSTYRYMEFVNAMRVVYPGAKVAVCRDHCGPGFNGIYDFKDTYETIKTDIECGFDLIHIDFSKMHGSHEAKIGESINAIEYAQKLRADIQFEIGTDEITDTTRDLKRLESDVLEFTKACNPLFFVVNSGSHTLMNAQIGTFDIPWLVEARKVIRGYGMKVKEHNADYMDHNQIKLRRGIIDAVNIAPELGHDQTQTLLSAVEMCGLDQRAWTKVVLEGRKWEKWMINGGGDDWTKILAAGHYHFNSVEYRELVSRIQASANRGFSKQNFINPIKRILARYDNCMEYSNDDATL
jgi:hypothetical protein